MLHGFFGAVNLLGNAGLFPAAQVAIQDNEIGFADGHPDVGEVDGPGFLIDVLEHPMGVDLGGHIVGAHVDGFAVRGAAVAEP